MITVKVTRNERVAKSFFTHILYKGSIYIKPRPIQWLPAHSTHVVEYVSPTEMLLFVILSVCHIAHNSKVELRQYNLSCIIWPCTYSLMLGLSANALLYSVAISDKVSRVMKIFKNFTM